MAAMTYLQKHPKTGIYRFRRSIPPELRDRIGKGVQYVESLGTKDCKEAKRLLPAVAVRVQKEFDRALDGGSVDAALSSEQAEGLAKSWLVDELDVDASRRRRGLQEGWIETDEAGMEEAEPHLRNALITGNFGVIKREIVWVLDQEGINADPGSDTYQNLGHALVWATLELYDLQRSRNVGDWPEVPEAPPAQQLKHPANPATVSDDGTPRMSEILEKWLAERKPTRSSEMEWATAVRRFNECHGELPVGSVTKGHVVKFKDALLQLPNGQHLTHVERALPITEIIEKFKGRNDVKRSGVGTVKKQLGAIHTLLAYAHDNAYVEFNPTHGVKVAAGRDANNEPSRKSLDIDDLNALFVKSPMFASPTIGARRTAKFWIPLMAMYTGGRLTELTQLFVGDVKSTPDGSHYLDFVHDPSSARFTKTKKTRQVPVHPDLLRCGFLEFVGWRRNQAEGDINARLFGELTIGPKGRSVWTCRGLVPVT